jgi:hypothetical protein
MYYLLGMPLSKWYGWGQNIYAPCDGKIITMKDEGNGKVHLDIGTA